MTITTIAELEVELFRLMGHFIVRDWIVVRTDDSTLVVPHVRLKGTNRHNPDDQKEVEVPEAIVFRYGDAVAWMYGAMRPETGGG